MIFENVHLYAPFLGNVVNHIVLESITMGAIFHHYKILLQTSKENQKIDEDSIKARITLLSKSNLK
jgi:hypothetical protein